MELLSVVMLSFVGCFIALIITLVFLNLIIIMSGEDKPKTKVLTREYDVPNKQDSQELFDTGKVSNLFSFLIISFAVPFKRKRFSCNIKPF